MIEILSGLVAKQVLIYAGGSIGAFVIAWILKRIPNEKIKMVIGGIMYRAGVAVTLGLSKWKVTAKFWNKVIEPWFVDFIDNVIGHGIQEFIRGLRSDN
jgi:uncharacterized membrane protein YfcA